jgi:Xaa-Pro dipeptidase
MTDDSERSLTSRRRFVGLVAGTLGGVAIMPAPASVAAEPAPAEQDFCDLPAPIAALRPMLDGVAPISDAERRARIERARRLMAEQRIDALLFEPGSSFSYYFNVSWGLSERPFLAVLPSRGEIAFVCPGFEENRARELVGAASDVRIWQEDESPYQRVAQVLRDRGVASARIGVEERLRFFIVDGVRQAAPTASFVSAAPVTTGCRMIKSPAELALMQRASDITMRVFQAAFATMREGMTNAELARNCELAFARLGASSPFALVMFGAATAFPHGTVQPQRLREGDIVLADIGCKVEGYASDITRTTVFGRPTPRQTEIWNLERRAQDAAFAAARVGASCESVDAAARKVITDAGFGPDYRLPGLPHRTGHGIGLDGHEAPNFVRGNTLPLQPGMCFSDEPTIVIFGEFGIRLEDCLYITENGPRFFSPQSEAIDRPW